MTELYEGPAELSPGLNSLTDAEVNGLFFTPFRARELRATEQDSSLPDWWERWDMPFAPSHQHDAAVHLRFALDAAKPLKTNW
jgi:hypothetical protein